MSNLKETNIKMIHHKINKNNNKYHQKLFSLNNLEYEKHSFETTTIDSLKNEHVSFDNSLKIMSKISKQKNSRFL